MGMKEIFKNMRRRWENEHQVKVVLHPREKRFEVKEARAHIVDAMAKEIANWNLSLAQTAVAQMVRERTSIAGISFCLSALKVLLCSRQPDFEGAVSLASDALGLGVVPCRIPKRYLDRQNRSRTISGVDEMTERISR